MKNIASKLTLAAVAAVALLITPVAANSQSIWGTAYPVQTVQPDHSIWSTAWTTILSLFS